MRIIYTQELVRANGTVERRSSEFELPEVILGRGGRSQLLLSGRLVSLEHARISNSNGVWTISDLNSLSGIRINNTRVASATLKSGDAVRIGQAEFTVAIHGDDLTLTRREVETESLTGEESVEEQGEKLRIDFHLPRMRTLSLVLGAIVLVWWGFRPLGGGNYDSWSSGPLSNAHKMIERDCRACHSTSFSSVQDKDCLACHSMKDHAKNFASFIEGHANLDMRCAECHFEHSGDQGLIQRDSRLCQGCHAGMQTLNPKTDLLNVTTLQEHPQFRISVPQPGGASKRVSIDDTANAKDHTPIKLNHAVHLKKGLRGPNGPVDLQCNACHELEMDKRMIKPISFDRHCRDCHSLGFDERLPNSQLPHGDAAAVYSTLFAEYSKLLLLNDGKAFPGSPGGGREMPSEEERRLPRDLTPQALRVERMARRAETEVFTRTGCFLCHSYTEKPVEEWRLDESRYLITEPNVPSVWFSKARFHHGAHDTISCESCHQKTRKSTETSELLLPGIETCRDCHVQEERPGYVRSDCAQCHVYHEALEVPVQRKQDLVEYLNSLTR